MSDLPSANWSETDASNTAATPDGWPEGQAPSTVNNCARMMMGALKRWFNRSNSVKTTAGTNTAYTLTYDVAEAAYYDGEELSFIFHATCGAAPTLNRDGLGARNIRKFTAGAYANLAASDVLANQPVRVRYNLAATTFDIISMAFSLTDFVTTAGANIFTALQTFTAAINEAKGADIPSATTTDIGAATGNFVHVTGTTTITGLGTIQAGTRRIVEFTGILILTHNAVSLILPNNGNNITTAAGDVATFVSEGAGNWRCASYTPISGQPLAAAPITNSLGADVLLNNAGTYFTGPTIAQGTSGTWFVSGKVTIVNSSAMAVQVKLWDGTTVIDSAYFNDNVNTTVSVPIGLSGFITSPAGNLRISVRDIISTAGSIAFNASGNSKDSTITATRIG